MANGHKLTRVIWAADPFVEDTDLQRRTGEFLTSLFQKSGAKVEPVSVIHFKDQSKKTNGIIEAVHKQQHSQPPMTLIHDDLSLSNAVTRLIRYARETKADLIAVGTQAKKGATRFLLGSFAETLILQSDTPILVINPLTRFSEEFRRILYPTDLSKTSRAVFPSVVEFARDTGVAIHIFHSAVSKKMADEVRPGLEELAALARSRGVEVEVTAKTTTGTVDSIVQFSETTPGIIVAMVSQSQAFESFVLGPTTRQVIHRAASPVWVLHPKKTIRRN